MKATTHERLSGQPSHATRLRPVQAFTIIELLAVISTLVVLAINPGLKNTPAGTYGFPKKLHDNAATQVPFISDKAGSSTLGAGFAMPPTGKTSMNPADCSPNTAHFVNGVRLGVNAAYADGHVEAHTPQQMNCGYQNRSSVWWFY